MSCEWIEDCRSFLMDVFAFLLSFFRKDVTDNFVNHERKRKLWKHDQDYFKSYADIHVHEEMLSDTVRTNAYRYAILKNFENIRGKVVADVGAGTGILSVFCVHAGAKKVYAIEASDMAYQTKEIANENHMATRIEVIHNTAEGYCLFYESMLPSVLHCRDNWLKQDGIILPSTASLFIAPFNDENYDRRLDFWSDVRSMYKLSMESMKPYAKKCIANQVHVCCVPPESVQAHAQQICFIDLKTAAAKDIQILKKDFEFTCFGHSKIHGFTTWFEVGFPESVNLSTSPYAEETHWSQTQFYVEEPFNVIQDTKIKGSISIQPHPGSPRFLDIGITYQVGDGASYQQFYSMNDCSS